MSMDDVALHPAVSVTTTIYVPANRLLNELEAKKFCPLSMLYCIVPEPPEEFTTNVPFPSPLQLKSVFKIPLIAGPFKLLMAAEFFITQLFPSLIK